MNHQQDEILHVSVAGGEARALVARTTAMVAQASVMHGASAAATAALGRALTAAAMLGCQLKSPEHAVTLQINGGGPLGSVVCTAHGDGRVKGYVDDPTADAVASEPDAPLVSAVVGCDGYLRLIRASGLKEPYIGQVALQTGEIAEDLAHYLTVSEGRPSVVALGAQITGGAVAEAAGLILEPMPGCSQETLHELELCLPLMGNLSRDMADLGG